ncbi:MAG: hypothetical protein JSS94_05520 [Bacteroidetes bacterium]|nr:hypothetical protein [Bacteroidota bacterium]
MKKFIICLLGITALYSMQSCGSTDSVAKTITVKSGELPADINNPDYTLIGTLKERNSYDKYLIKGFEQYNGKYVLATENEIKNKYTDIDKYRYQMDYERESGEVFTASKNQPLSGRPYQSVPGKRFYILDRKTNKKYIRKTWSSFYAKEIQAYIKAIEANN